MSSSGLRVDNPKVPEIGLRFALDSPSVSLADVLHSVELEKDKFRRLLLSYLLSKAVWQFYTSELAPGNWTKHAVQFMKQERNLLDNRPFVRAEFEALVSSTDVGRLADPRRSTHIFPKVLALGVLLLEIELGKGIESYICATNRDENDDPKDNAIHITVGEIIKSDVWTKRIKSRKTYDVVDKAINICVRPDTTQLGTQPAQVQQRLYDSVVVMLETMLRMMHPDFGPLDLEPMQHLPLARSSSTKNASPKRQVRPGRQALNNGLRSNTALLSSISEVRYGSILVTTLTALKISNSSSWLDQFDRAIMTLNNSAEGSNACNAVKIAILDTGCNTDDDFFSDLGMGYLDNLQGSGRWHDCVAGVPKPIDEDPDNHGTALLALLLRLVPSAAVYVIRVAKDVEGLAQADQSISKARTYALNVVAIY